LIGLSIGFVEACQEIFKNTAIGNDNIQTFSVLVIVRISKVFN